MSPDSLSEGAALWRAHIGAARTILLHRWEKMKAECASDYFGFRGKTYPCPLSVAMDLVGGKWRAVIIYHLQHGKKRFGELHADLSGVTEATLSRQLQQLEEDGLIAKRLYGSKPPLRSEYALTDLGNTFLPALDALTAWGNQVLAAQEQENGFDREA